MPALYYKPLESITEADLQALVDSRDSETKTLEYKEKLPESTSSARKEFLADVSSFANAIGGDIIFGIRADKGVPIELCGLPLSDVDATKLALEDSIRNNIRPRIPFTVRALHLQDSTRGVVLIIRIGKGYAPPHQIVVDKDYRFYSRNSAGKYRLDVDELRTIFELAGTTAQRIRDFRAERLANIVAEQTPVMLDEGPRLVLHIVPLSAFSGSSVDVGQLLRSQQEDYLEPISATEYRVKRRYNLDGLLRWEEGASETTADSYVQLFRNGILEAADRYALTETWIERGSTGEPFISADTYEKRMLGVFPKYLAALKGLGVEPPVILMVSLLGVHNFKVTFQRSPHTRYGKLLIDRRDLVLPDIQLESFELDPAEVLKPIFDAVANSGGWARSVNYTTDGDRLPEPER